MGRSFLSGRLSLSECARCVAAALALAACGTASEAVDDDFIASDVAALVGGDDAVAPDAAPLRHAPSGMIFPARLAGLERDQAEVYDPRGDDLSVGYHRIDDHVALSATIYVYPADSTLERDFAAAEAAVVEQRPGATLIAEGALSIEQGGRWHEGRRAHFLVRDESGKTPTQISHLFLFQHGPWRIKYRATVIARQHAEADLALIRFMRELEWPELDLGDVARR